MAEVILQVPSNAGGIFVGAPSGRSYQLLPNSVVSALPEDVTTLLAYGLTVTTNSFLRLPLVNFRSLTGEPVAAAPGAGSNFGIGVQYNSSEYLQSVPVASGSIGTAGFLWAYVPPNFVADSRFGIRVVVRPHPGGGAISAATLYTGVYAVGLNGLWGVDRSTGGVQSLDLNNEKTLTWGMSFAPNYVVPGALLVFSFDLELTAAGATAASADITSVVIGPVNS